MQWIGIDVAKRSFTAAQRTRAGFEAKRFAMTPRGFQRFLAWCSPQRFHVALEPTGPYWLPLAEWLEAAGLAYAVLNPRKVRQFALASHHRSKTDAVDAEILVRCAEAFAPECVTLPQGAYRALRSLSRRILQLQGQLDRERDRLEKAQADPATPEEVLDSFQITLHELQGLVERLERRAHRLVLDDPQLRRAHQLLLSIPGVGPKTTRTLLAEYGPRILTATPKQMTRFAGLDVVLWESGSSVRKRPRISKQGCWRVRRALYLAALSAIRFNPDLAPFYRRKIQQGLAPKQALVAVMRKLLHITHGVLKNQTPFQPQTA